MSAMTTSLMKTTTLLFCRRRRRRTTTTTGGKGKGGVLLPSSWERRTLRTRSRKRTAATKAADDDDDDGNNKSNKIGPTAAEPTAMDAETFNQLVSLGTWDKIVPECKRLALIGKITDGVLGQAYVVLTACKNQGEDENVLKTLENIIQLLTQTLLQLEADSPSKRALDEMMTLNPDETFDGKAACREIAERLDASVDDVVLELQKFLKNCELQDAAFERDLALATETDNREEFDRLTGLVTAKLEAKRRTLAILGYLEIS